MSKETIKVVDIEDLDIKYVLLSNGEYLVDGEIVSISGYRSEKTKVKVKDIESIKLVSEDTIKSHYEDADGNRMSVEDYSEKKNNYLKDAIYDEYDGYYFSDDKLDEEYAYKKFSKKWTLINRKVQLISDPIKVEVVKTIYDTGNPFIRNLLKHGEEDKNKDNIICVYDRPNARKDILEKYMSSIGISFVGDKSRYNLRTEWANSNHSIIYYAKAFGSYILNSEEWKRENKPSGTLSDCLLWYESDKSRIEDIVHKKFMEAFGVINEENFDFSELIKVLKNTERNIINIDSKIKTMQDYNSSRKLIKQAIEMIEIKMEVK